jgi:hypothetical protein
VEIDHIILNTTIPTMTPSEKEKVLLSLINKAWDIVSKIPPSKDKELEDLINEWGTEYDKHIDVNTGELLPTIE